MEEKKKIKKGGCLKNMIIAIIIFVGIGAIFGKSNDAAQNPADTPPAQTQQTTETEPEPETQPATAPAPNPAPTEPEKPKEPEMTKAQKNALASANNYLSFSAFSRAGLIKQLEFEQYETEDATFAADNCGADWKEQAVKSAKNYLSFSSFSEKELISQLEFEGFTAEEAAHGASIAFQE